MRVLVSILLLLGAAYVVWLLWVRGVELDTDYGTTRPGSINGLSLLHGELEARCRLRRSWLLSPRLQQECDLLVHVARNAGLPGPDAARWIEEWLDGAADRQVLLVLRDGSLGEALCLRWAAEARYEAGRQQDPAGRDALVALAARLEARASVEARAEPPALSDRCGLFRLHSASAVAPIAWQGLGLPADAVPWGLRLGSWPEAEYGESLLAGRVSAPGEAELPHRQPTELRPWAIVVPVGRGRLVVAANALPLLDGAQADRRARRICAALVDELLSGRPAGSMRGVWLDSLRIASSDQPRRSPLAILAQEPFVWVLLHGLAALLVWLGLRAAWLGRREAPPERRLDRFSAHVEALAAHLKDLGAAHACADALARWWKRPAPPATAARTPAEAARWLRQCSRRDPSPIRTPSKP